MARIRVRFSMHSLDGLEVSETYEEVRDILKGKESHVELHQVGGDSVQLHRDTVVVVYPDLPKDGE